MTPPPTDAFPPDRPTDPASSDPAMADPMLRVLRELHPGVDVVVLPQPAPAPVAPELTSAERDGLAAALDRSLDDLLARVVPDPEAAPVVREARWHTDEWGQSWYSCTAVVGPLATGGNIALLRATGHALVGLGWQARPVPGDRPRLVARRRGGLEGAATVRPDSVVLDLRTAKVRAVQEVAS
ncbi:hypothetical protein [Nocardioides renjunii]|uniref:hypothetical protein n=1 Tax=Nocardioides renjunii TaxID=3095075 RepID=UPI002AFF09CC|nr:hypothetical protein [Nocardioides sp. S-34]WQQ23891.1 hypothetical protein SHK17_07865 [Nocardioides sp. S-34]